MALSVTIVRLPRTSLTNWDILQPIQEQQGVEVITPQGLINLPPSDFGLKNKVRKSPLFTRQFHNQTSSHNNATITQVGAYLEIKFIVQLSLLHSDAHLDVMSINDFSYSQLQAIINRLVYSTCRNEPLEKQTNYPNKSEGSQSLFMSILLDDQQTIKDKLELSWAKHSPYLGQI